MVINITWCCNPDEPAVGEKSTKHLKVRLRLTKAIADITFRQDV